MAAPVILVYLAGPLSAAEGFSVAQNVDEALAIYFELVARGVNPFSPHLIALDARAHAIDYERWMAYDFAWIEACSHVLMLPRWRTSGGACRERVYALAIGKVVVHDKEELFA